LRPNFGADVRTMREYVQFLQGCGYLGLLKYSYLFYFILIYLGLLRYDGIERYLAGAVDQRLAVVLYSTLWVITVFSCILRFLFERYSNL